MRLFLIQKSDLDVYWPKLEPEFERVVRKAVFGEFDTQGIKNLVERNLAHLAALEDEDGTIHMALAFEFRIYPSQKLAVNVFAMGGRNLIQNMREFFPLFQEWCKSFGAVWIECLVSAGMERMHLRSGFKTVYKQMRFDLQEADSVKE